MKKSVIVFLLICFVLAGCRANNHGTNPVQTSSVSGTTSAHTSQSSTSACDVGSKYTYLDPGYLPFSFSDRMTNSTRISAVKGGALFFLASELYYSDTSVFAGQPGYGEALLAGIYDEGSNSLVPLCFRTACDHKSGNCFANAFYGQTLRDFWVCDGEIYVLNQLLEVFRYSFDGTLLSSQRAAEYGSYWADTKDSVFREDGNVFIIATLDNGAKNGPVTKRIIKYSINEKTFTSLGEFTSETPIRIRMGHKIDGVYYFTFDFSVYSIDPASGGTALCRDWSEALSAANKLTGQSVFSDITYSYDYSKVCMSYPSAAGGLCSVCYDFNAKTAYEDLNESMRCVMTADINQLSLGGALFVPWFPSAPQSPEEDAFAFMNVETGEVTDIKLSYGGRDRRISRIIAETETGFIFNAYLRENERSDLGRLVWISREDYFSGNWGNYNEINMMY